jgi:colanic acid/amylovoran biosynthesis glycosyltransferase
MNVLILVSEFLALSETFIYSQIQGMDATEKVIVCHQILNTDIYEWNGLVYQIDAIPKTFKDRALSAFFRYFKIKNSYAYPVNIENELTKIIRLHNINFVVVHFGYNALKILPLAKKFNLPLVVCFHGYDASKLLKVKPYYSALPALFNYASHIILVAPFMYDNLIPYGIDRNKTSIIPYGIDLSLFNNLPKRRCATNRDLIIIHAGRLTAKKGVLDLVNVVAELKIYNFPFKLHIVGDGEERNVIESKIAEENLEDFVVSFGAMPHNKLLEKLQDADIFVLNSRINEDGDSEGYPNAILEAMATGLAVISTYHAGIPNIVDNGLNGLLVEERNNHQLKDALVKVLSDNYLREKLQNNAREKALKYFDKEIKLEQINMIFREIIQSTNKII